MLGDQGPSSCSSAPCAPRDAYRAAVCVLVVLETCSRALDLGLTFIHQYFDT